MSSASSARFSAFLPPQLAAAAAELHAASLRASSQRAIASKARQYELAVAQLGLGEPYPVQDHKVWAFVVWLRDRGTVHPAAFKQYVSAVATVARLRGQLWVHGPEVSSIIAGCVQLLQPALGVCKRGYLPASVALQVLRAGDASRDPGDMLAALVVQFCFIFFSRGHTALALRDADVTLSADAVSLVVTAFSHKGKSAAESALVPPQVFPTAGVPELPRLLQRFRLARGAAGQPPDSYLLSLDFSRPSAAAVQAWFCRGLALPGVLRPPPNVSWTSHSGRHGGATAAYQSGCPSPWIAAWGAWAPASPCLALYVHVTAPHDPASINYFGQFISR
jgi:hypothetical protein